MHTINNFTSSDWNVHPQLIIPTGLFRSFGSASKRVISRL